MNYPSAMHGVERAAELHHQWKRTRDRHGAAPLEVFVESLTHERFEYQVRRMRPCVSKVDELNYVWMPNPREQRRLSVHSGPIGWFTLTRGSQPFTATRRPSPRDRPRGKLPYL